MPNLGGEDGGSGSGTGADTGVTPPSEWVRKAHEPLWTDASFDYPDSRPGAITQDDSGSIWVADRKNASIYEFTQDGSVVSTNTPPNDTPAFGFEFGPGGSVWVSHPLSAPQSIVTSPPSFSGTFNLKQPFVVNNNTPDTLAYNHQTGEIGVSDRNDDKFFIVDNTGRVSASFSPSSSAVGIAHANQKYLIYERDLYDSVGGRNWDGIGDEYIRAIDPSVRGGQNAVSDELDSRPLNWLPADEASGKGGVDIGPNGSLWLTDRGNGRVIKYQQREGRMEDEVTTPQDTPTDIHVDSSGSLWVASDSSSQITKVAQTGSVVTDFDHPCYRPDGITVDDNQSVWTAYSDDSLTQLTQDGSVVQNRNMSIPAQVRGLTFRSTDSMFWAGQRYDNSVIIMRESGDRHARYEAPSYRTNGVAVEPDGGQLWVSHRNENVYMTDRTVSASTQFDARISRSDNFEAFAGASGSDLYTVGNCMISRMDVPEAGGFERAVGTHSSSRPRGMDVSDAGEIWIADTNTDEMHRYDKDMNEMLTVPSPGSNPEAVAIEPDEGSIWLSDTSDNSIYKMNWIGSIVAGFQPEDRIKSLDFDAETDCLWGGTEYEEVQRFDQNGSIDLQFSTNRDTDDIEPDDLAVRRGDDSIYVQDKDERLIVRFDQNGSFTGYISHPSYYNNPGLAFDPTEDGEVVYQMDDRGAVENNPSYQVIRKQSVVKDALIQDPNDFQYSNWELSNTEDMAVDADTDSVWISDSGSHIVFNQQGTPPSVLSLDRIQAAPSSNARGLTIDSDSSLWIGTRFREACQIFDLESRSLTLPARQREYHDPSAEIDFTNQFNPRALDFDPDGSLWIADSGNDYVYHVRPSDGSVINSWLTYRDDSNGSYIDGNNQLEGMAVGPGGSPDIFTSDSDNCIYRHNPNTGRWVESFTVSSTEFGNKRIERFAFDDAGSIWGTVDNDCLYKVNAEGSIIDRFDRTPCLTLRNREPCGFAVDPDSDNTFYDLSQEAVTFRTDLNNTVAELYFGFGTNNQRGVAVDDDGSVWVSHDNSTVRQVRPNQIFNGGEDFTPSPVEQPNIIKTAPNGSLWVSGNKTNKIHQIDNGGIVHTTVEPEKFSVGSTAVNLEDVRGFDVDPDGFLWVANGDGSVYKVGQDGTKHDQFSGVGAEPADIHVDDSGSVWVLNAEEGHTRVYRTRGDSSLIELIER